MTPTGRTIERLTEEGWHAGNVERQVNRVLKADLFGFADIMAFRDDEELLVQACSGCDVQKRLRKVLANAAAYDWLSNPGRLIEVWGWRALKVKGDKRRRNWAPRIVPIHREDFK